MAEEGRVFGAEPDGLRRLITSGLEADEAEAEAELPGAASVVGLMEGPGTTIGPYKLLHVLGEGGMGIVYLAAQEGPIRRHVALKIIKPGMDSKRVIARFDTERQVLALLDHPGIAHVYDAGTTSSGRPYFVMEYIKGTAITDYCDHHMLSIEDRLRLFQRVCLAVHHAHQKGVVHRDIKPSNILVSTEGDEAIPKIIDFGVAKAMSQSLIERTLVTEDTQLLGTPEYVSPEQADMLGDDIDTRSDVYSLGVVLYVLLTGVLPFDPEELRDGGIEHIRKTIRETNPKTPSTRLTRLGEEARLIAERRRTQIQVLAKCLHSELEWIPLKAMRKERAERYRSAAELADDIEHYLQGVPLIAGPLTAGYRLRKSLHRHRALVAGVIVVVVALTAGLIASATSYFRAERLRIVAQQAAEREIAARTESEAVTAFLERDVLASVGLIKGRDATMVDVLNVASKNLEGRFQDQPLVEARIHFTLARAYGQLFDHQAATPHLACSYQIYRNCLGEDEHSTAIAKDYLALAYYHMGHYREAENLFKELIESCQRSKPEDANLLGTLKGNLACVYVEQARYREAELFFLASLETAKPWWESWSPKGNPYLIHLADTYLYQGRYEEAEQLFNRYAADHGDGALGHRIMPRLGYLYMAQKRYDEAADLFARGIAYGHREFPGRDHPKTLTYMNGLAVLHTKRSQYDEAERLFHEVLEIRKRKLGEDHPHTLESMHELAVLYLRQARHEDAEPLLLDAFHGRETKLGPEHPHTLESLKQLVSLYESWPKPDEAAKWRTKLAEVKPNER